MQATQDEEMRKQAEAAALKAAQDEEQRAKVARMKEITLVLLDLNGNPGQTFMNFHGSISGPQLPVKSSLLSLFFPIATYWGSKSSELTR